MNEFFPMSRLSPCRNMLNESHQSKGLFVFGTEALSQESRVLTSSSRASRAGLPGERFAMTALLLLRPWPPPTYAL